MVSAFQKTVSVLFWLQLSRYWLQLIQPGEQLIQQRDSCSHQKVLRLLEKLYDFLKSGTTFSRLQLSQATAVSYSGTANTATATAIPRAGTAISRTYLMCERIVKRSWNVGSAPVCPRALCLQGFQQICERWNLFFEKQFSLLAQWMASRENKL